MRTATVFVLTLVVLAGCGATSTPTARPRGDRLAPATLYPMIEGAQWVYDVHTGGDEPPTLGIFEVTSVEGARRSISNNRGMDSRGQVTYGDAIVYEAEADGIRHVASGAWVLRGPLRDGATWEAMGGRTARVVDLDASVEVPAGRYEHCVEVEETGGEDGRTVRTVYCPEVGPVLVESRMSSQLTLRSVGTRSVLRSYDEGGVEEP
jgi:hypothetical protein